MKSVIPLLYNRNMEFKYLIIQLRDKLMMSQEEFSKYVGVSFATVNRWENGYHNPTFKYKRKILKICSDFEINVNQK